MFLSNNKQQSCVVMPLTAVPPTGKPQGISDRLCLIGLIIILFFSGCAAEKSTDEEARYNLAVENAWLLPLDAAEPKTYTLGEVRYGRLTYPHETAVTVVYPEQQRLWVEQDGGILQMIPVSVDMWVAKGTVLAELLFNTDALAREHSQLMLAMEAEEQAMAYEKTLRLEAIEQHKNNITPDMDDLALAVHAVQLEKLETAYRYFLWQHASALADYADALAALAQKKEGIRITAPFDGMITYINTMAPYSEVPQGTHLFTLADTRTFQLETIDSVLNLRYGSVVEITAGNDLQFLAQVVSDPLADRKVTADTFTKPQVAFLLQPLDDTLMADLLTQRNIRLRAKQIIFDRDDLLLIPRAGVWEELDKDLNVREYVLLYEHGGVKRRYIQTGYYYFDTIQVLVGLEAGQQIVLH